MVDQSLTILFFVYNCINFDKIPTPLIAPYHDWASTMIADLWQETTSDSAVEQLVAFCLSHTWHMGDNLQEQSLNILQCTPKALWWTPYGSLWSQCVEIINGSCVMLIQHQPLVTVIPRGPEVKRSAWLSCPLMVCMKAVSDCKSQRKCEFSLVAGSHTPAQR